MKNIILIKDLMTPDVVSVRPETSLLDASEAIVSNQFNGLPVIDEEGKVVGILTEYDLLSKGTAIHLPTFIKLFGAYPDHQKEDYLIGKNLGDILSFTVKDVMNSDPLTMRQDDTLTALVDQFSTHHHVNPIPIVDHDGKLVGIVSRFDIVRYYASILQEANNRM